MPETPLFSIITITLNNLEGLKNTALSIQHQTNADYEWLVIDGGSTDESTDHLKTTTANWISEPDNGLYDAMNKGIDRASGQYLLFLNAGDTLAEADTLANLAEALHTCSITPDFIYGDSLEDIKESEAVYKPARPYTKIIQGMFTHHQAMLYRREALGSLRYDLQYTIAADYDLTIKFLKETNKTLYLPAPLCIFESGGISQQNAKLGRHEQFQIRKANHLCPPLKNRAISLSQFILWKIKTFFPHLYWGLKSRAH